MESVMDIFEDKAFVAQGIDQAISNGELVLVPASDELITSRVIKRVCMTENIYSFLKHHDLLNEAIGQAEQAIGGMIRNGAEALDLADGIEYFLEGTDDLYECLYTCAIISSSEDQVIQELMIGLTGDLDQLTLLTEFELSKSDMG